MENELSNEGRKPSHGPINEKDFLLFRDFVNDKCGILIPPEKAYLIETRLTKLMLSVGADTFGEFYAYLSSHPFSPLTQKIINAITTHETFWFRDVSPWKLLEDVLMPRLVEELASGKKIRARIWSSAVSTGQEIYSTVMCIDNYLAKNRVFGVDLSCFDFFATDISSDSLEIARRGRYDSISIMRGLDDHYKSKYFVKTGSAWDLDPRIRNAVRFEQFNLKKDFGAFGVFDIIFCRYVLIYFSDELKKDVTERMNHALSDNGVLLTGSYVLFDLLQGNYVTNHYGNMSYFTKKGLAQL